MGSAGTVQYERVGHAQGRCAIIASFKRAEYAADFIMLARRALAMENLDAFGRRLEELHDRYLAGTERCECK